MIASVLKRAFDRLSDTIAGRRLPLRVDVLPRGQTLVLVRSVGLAQFSLPELEIDACPPGLIRYATEIVLQVAANGLHEPAALQDGKTIGGRFVSPKQRYLEVLRLEKAVVGNGGVSVMCICDLEHESAGRFPGRLIATHLCALAESNPADRELYLDIATGAYPRVTMASSSELTDSELNPNNFWAWAELGNVYADSKRETDAVRAWKRAVCHWPRGGELLAATIIQAQKPLGSGEDRDARENFWLSVHNASINEWCRELGISLPESALA